MNLTETVIREQFPLWRAAMARTLPALPEGRLVITGCGTSFYLAQTLAAAFNLAGREALAVPGAEWARRPHAWLADPAGSVVVGLSRSGTTTETLQALAASRAAGLTTVGISCAQGTPLTAGADVGITLDTHPGEGIVMTASASLMLLAGLRLAGAALPAPDAAEAAMRAVEGLRPLIEGRRHFVYLGGGALYGMATEGALKLTEMSITFGQAFHPMEFRHGPISLIDEGSVVVMLYSGDGAAEEARLLDEVAAKGARTIGLGGPGDLSVRLTEDGPGRALEVLPALQMIGERVANMKGADTAAPRHLSKVVLLKE